MQQIKEKWTGILKSGPIYFRFDPVLYRLTPLFHCLDLNLTGWLQGRLSLSSFHGQ